MKSTGLILQFFAALSVAASLAWLAETWKLEGKLFVEEQEKRGGIEKTRLIAEGGRMKAEIVEKAEADARVLKGVIDGATNAKADAVVKGGERDRTLLKEQSTLAQAYAMEAMTGLDHLADRFAGLAREGRGDTDAYQTIERYLRRAYGAYQELRALSWGPSFSCSTAHDAAARIASGLAYGANRNAGPNSGRYEGTQVPNPFADREPKMPLPDAFEDTRKQQPSSPYEIAPSLIDEGKPTRGFKPIREDDPCAAQRRGKSTRGFRPDCETSSPNPTRGFKRSS